MPSAIDQGQRASVSDADNPVGRSESAERVVGRVLDPGEEILWVDRPNLVALMTAVARFRKRRVVGLAVVMPLVLAILYYGPTTVFGPELGGLSESLAVIPTQAKIAMAGSILLIVAVSALSSLLKLGPVHAHERWARSLT